MSRRIPLPVFALALLAAASAGVVAGARLKHSSAERGGDGAGEETRAAGKPDAAAHPPSAPDGSDDSSLRADVARLRKQVADEEARAPKERTAEEWRARARRIADLLSGRAEAGDPREMLRLQTSLDPAMASDLLAAFASEDNSETKKHLLDLAFAAGGPDAAEWLRTILADSQGREADLSIVRDLLGRLLALHRYGQLVSEGPLFDAARSLASDGGSLLQDLGFTLLSLRDCEESRRLLTDAVDASKGHSIEHPLRALCRIGTVETDGWFAAFERRLTEEERTTMEGVLSLARKDLRRRALQREGAK